MKHYDGQLSGRCFCDFTEVGENIQYQHNSSLGILIFRHFIPIQWHSTLSILDTEQQIYFNILPPQRPRKEDDPLLRSVLGNQIVIHTLVEKPKLSNSSILIWKKDMVVFALQPLKNLNASHIRILARVRARVDRLCGDTCPYVCPQSGLN